MESCGSGRPRPEPYVRMDPYTVYGLQYYEGFNREKRFPLSYSRLSLRRPLWFHEPKIDAETGILGKPLWPNLSIDETFLWCP